MEHLDTDALAIWSYMQHHEQELLQKRKFLMGLSATDCFNKKGRSQAGNQSILLESFLRKDDVFYEDVKSFVERGFGACDTVTGRSIINDDMQFCEKQNLSRFILTLLDDLSNNGMYRVAKIVTRGSVFFEKTRPQMKKVIRNSLPEICSNQFASTCKVKIQNQLSELLKNPKTFSQNYGKYLNLTLKSHRSAVMKVLDGLEDMPTQTLSAMYRKLKGKQGFMPQLHPHRSGWNRDRLVDRVRQLSFEMIYQLGESDRLQEPLAKALAVAGLSSKITYGYQDLSGVKFVHITPEVEALQNEIVKAIRLLGQRIRKEEIKNLHHLLDPESEVDHRGLKTSIKNMLIDFLFECSDMDAVPESLFSVLSLVNKKPCNTRRFFSKDVIEEEVECILDVGAHIKQVLWDWVPDDKVVQDFADAYMEELEESDDGDIFDDDDDDDHHRLDTNSSYEVGVRSNDFSEEVASTRDADHDSFSSPPAYKDNLGNKEFASSLSSGATSFVDEDECRDTEIRGGEMLISTTARKSSSPLLSPMLQEGGDMSGREDIPNNTPLGSVNSADKCAKQNPMSEYQRNQYVALQEVCDQASVVAYQLVGHVLEEVGRMEALGLDWDDESYLRGEYSRPEHFQDPVADSMGKDVSGSIIVQAVHNVIPSFSSSQLEIVKKFMSS